MTSDDIKRLSYKLAESLDASKFFIQRDEGRGALSIVDVWQQDGPDLWPEQNETFVRVHMWSRYYGVSYERGDLLFICAVAEWLEQNIPGCEVWYGGDSSGVIAEPFPATTREELRKHLYSAYGHDYFHRENDKELNPPTGDCKLCIPGRHPTQFGYGQGYRLFTCAGCGWYFAYNNGEWKASARREDL